MFLITIEIFQLKEMRSKHPAATRPLPQPPVTDTPPRTFGTLEVTKAALSFKKGTAAGPSGLRPEHLQVAMKCTPSSVANKAQTALTKLVNAMAKGQVPSRVAPYLCGARLHAARKKDETLRPIAVGNLLRRLTAKCFSTALADRAAALLSPQQLGVGVRGGAEAIAHAVREAVKTDPSRYVLQADLINAYNTVERGAMMEEVARHFPECLPWVVTCYGKATILKFGDAIIISNGGPRRSTCWTSLLPCPQACS